MTKALLEERLAKVRAALARQQAAHAELLAQMHALRGREAELVELIAVPDETT